MAKIYKLINDEEELQYYIDWLPQLRVDECYYLMLFARKKYDTTGLLKTDKGLLKRVVVRSKDFFVPKIRQLECRLGSYVYDGKSIDNSALVLYMMPNPRSLVSASYKTIRELSLNLERGRVLSPHTVAMNVLQKRTGKKHFLVFDFDGVEFDSRVFNAFLDHRAWSVIRTQGGFHIIVELKWIKGDKNWYQKMMRVPGVDVTGDILTPVPGCIQGGYTPRFYDHIKRVMNSYF